MVRELLALLWLMLISRDCAYKLTVRLAKANLNLPTTKVVAIDRRQ